MLEFDYPGLEIGVAHYVQGPTGTTVFRFADKTVGAVDVRGGAPGACNVGWLRWQVRKIVLLQGRRSAPDVWEGWRRSVRIQ